MGTAEELFAGNALALDALARVGQILDAVGPYDVRTTKTQVGFRRRRGFASLWDPGRWLRDPQADVVLSVALPRADGSPRWKEVVHPSARIWMHHLELRSAADLDAEVAGWLAEAYAAAG